MTFRCGCYWCRGNCNCGIGPAYAAVIEAQNMTATEVIERQKWRYAGDWITTNPKLEELKMTVTKAAPTPEPITNPAIKVLVERQASVVYQVDYYNHLATERESQAKSYKDANKPWIAEKKAVAAALKKLGHKG